MTDVFISYSHKDGDYAHQLAEELRGQQLDVWIDDRIDYGDRWPRVIQENLTGCRAFIVIMSTNAFNSTWVQNEVSYAQANDKIIFPMLLEGRVWLSLASMQYVDVRSGLMPPRKFADKIKHALGQPVVPVAEPDLKLRPQAPPRKSARLWVISIGALFLLCLTTGVVYGVLKATMGAGQGPGALAPEPTEEPTKPSPTLLEPTQPSPTEVPPTDVPPTQVPPTEPPTQPPPPTEDPFAGEFTSRDFHLAVGDVRTYKFGLASQSGGGITQEVGEVTERIVELDAESNELIQIFRVQRSGYMIGLDCPTEGQSQIYWYIRDETRIYTACTEEERTAILDALLRERLIMNGQPEAVLTTPTYLFPLTLYAKWSEWADVPVSDDIRYVWYVDAQVEEKSTFAGTFRNCYEVALRTNPDVTLHYLCKGLGLVAWVYHHNGTVDDYTGELWSYSFAP